MPSLGKEIALREIIDQQRGNLLYSKLNLDIKLSETVKKKKMPMIQSKHLTSFLIYGIC